MSSDPTLDDSDGDGLLDHVDCHPLLIEELSYCLEPNYDFDYIRIQNDESRLYGGYQGWWHRGELDDKFLINYYEYVNSMDYRIGGWGCGLIAASDFEIFMSQQRGYIHPYQKTVNWNSNGVVDMDSYRSYVEYNCKHIYLLSDYLQSYVLGVSPFSISNGIKEFLFTNGNHYAYVKWSPSMNDYELINTIEKMIQDNVPVIFSYYYKKDDLTLYYSYENAKNGLTGDGYSWDTNSHYMTIYGYTKYLKPNSNQYSYILEVVSWGKHYFIDYDEFKENISYTTNILEVDLTRWEN